MFSLAELVERLGGEVLGDAATQIARVAPLDSAVRGDLTFLANPKYRSRLATSSASAVVVGERDRAATERPCIVVDNPYLYFAQVARLLSPLAEAKPGVHPSAVLDSAVPASVEIGPGAVIEAGVELGEGVVIGAGCFVGSGCRIGQETRLYPRVVIYPGCSLGERCIVHAGAVIGADGFGFAREADGAWLKIPQRGGVCIGDDVEVGANTTIDRGALDDTVIGKGVKIDNLVQIAHNVHIGEHSILAGCAGVAGSARIGARVMVGGQAGISGHLEIADDVVVSAWTLVPKSIRQPGVYTSNLPLQSHAEWLKNFSHLRQLDARISDFSVRLKRLEADNASVTTAGQIPPL